MVYERAASRRGRSEQFQRVLDGAGSSAEVAGLADITAQLRAAGASDTIGPRDGFRSDVRAMLLSEAALRAVTLPEPRKAVPESRARHASARVAATTRRPATHRPLPAESPALRRQLAAGGVAFSLLAATGVLASQGALPGQHLYPVKRGVETLQLNVAQGDRERGMHLLAQAGTRTREVQRLLSQDGGTGDGASVAQTSAALTAAVHNLRAGRVLLLRAYASGDTAALSTLAGFVADQRDLVDALASVVPDELMVALRELSAEVDATANDVQRVRAACGPACDDPATASGYAGGSVSGVVNAATVPLTTSLPAQTADLAVGTSESESTSSARTATPSGANSSTAGVTLEASSAGVAVATPAPAASGATMPVTATPALTVSSETSGPAVNAAAELAASDAGLAGTSVAQSTDTSARPAPTAGPATPAPVTVDASSAAAPAVPVGTETSTGQAGAGQAGVGQAGALLAGAGQAGTGQSSSGKAGAGQDATGGTATGPSDTAATTTPVDASSDSLAGTGAGVTTAGASAAASDATAVTQVSVATPPAAPADTQSPPATAGPAGETVAATTPATTESAAFVAISDPPSAS